MKQFTAMVKARTMEFVRDRGTFFWNLIFPILLIIGFSFAFGQNRDQLYKIGIIGSPSHAVEKSFLEMKQMEIIDYSKDAADKGGETLVKKVRLHKIDMLIDFTTREYYLNTQSANADILRTVFANRNNLNVPDSQFTEQHVDGKLIRSVDWLVPGIIGMNMLFSCLFGVGFVIVRYRKNGVLKRLKATPVTAFNFVSAQMVSRFVIVLLTSIAVFAGTNIFLRFMMLGSYLNLLLITALSILCMISLGLIFAARIKSEELASGLINIINFPMIIFSGVFFSLEGTPQIMQKISKFFPLTHFIESARKIMLEGAGITVILPNVLVLAGMTILFLGIASFTFRWD